MKVWMVYKGYAYEGSEVVGVFDSFEKAKARYEELEAERKAGEVAVDYYAYDEAADFWEVE